MAANSTMPHEVRASMEPEGLVVRYEDVAAGGDVCTAERDVFAPLSDEAIDIDATFNGEVLEVAATAHEAVRLQLVQVRLRHAFASDEMVLLNGYQSWTDTVERLAWSRMRGLRGVPKAVVNRWAINGGGDYDYAFDGGGYTARRGEQHGFTYATFRRGERMALVGSLGEDRGFTLIRTNAAKGQVLVEPELPVGELPVGERVVLCRVAIVSGVEGACYDRWFELAGINARPARPLVGYTSWYRHYGDIDEGKLLHDLRGMRESAVFQRDESEGVPAGDGLRSMLALDARVSGAVTGAGVDATKPARHARGSKDETCIQLFQIDDGYCKVGDWLQVDEHKFPHGMAALATAARDAGFLPGLWVAPFICEEDSRLFHECSDWLLRDADGNPVRTGPQWSGGIALDTRNIEVRSYILDVLHTMTEEWGFGLLKADFLYAACMRPHDGLNRGELMADALELLRAGAGENTLILGCGVPLGTAFGRVEYCRIGCDVGLDWNDKLHMRMLHRERVSTKNSLGNTLGRAPLDGRAFGNDPDVFFLRDDVKLTQAQRDELLFADADCGSVFLTSDDMATWSDSARNRYAEALHVFLSRHRG